MVERPHITEGVARRVADAIRGEGGVFLGTPEWCMGHGFSEEDYEAFLQAGVRQGAEYDWRDSHGDLALAGTVSTVGVPRKVSVDGDKLTLTVAIDGSRASDVARLIPLRRQTCDISLTPADMPLPIEVPEGSRALPMGGDAE